MGAADSSSVPNRPAQRPGGSLGGFPRRKAAKNRLWAGFDAWFAVQPVRTDLNLAAMIFEDRGDGGVTL
jgi:hypothetical protein